jgi:hypothetical protein
MQIWNPFRKKSEEAAAPAPFLGEQLDPIAPRLVYAHITYWDDSHEKYEFVAPNQKAIHANICMLLGAPNVRSFVFYGAISAFQKPDELRPKTKVAQSKTQVDVQDGPETVQ